MALPFRLGVGGVIGSGRQYWSWIEVGDLVRAIELCLALDTLAGPVNAVAPTPVTNREFTRALGRVLGRPTLVPLPALAVRLLLGEMGQALLLDSARVLPQRLERAGFRFRHPDLETALRAALAGARPGGWLGPPASVLHRRHDRRPLKRGRQDLEEQVDHRRVGLVQRVCVTSPDSKKKSPGP